MRNDEWCEMVIHRMVHNGYDIEMTTVSNITKVDDVRKAEKWWLLKVSCFSYNFKFKHIYFTSIEKQVQFIHQALKVFSFLSKPFFYLTHFHTITPTILH